MNRIGTAAFHAQSHQMKYSQFRPAKSDVGLSTRPEVSVTPSQYLGVPAAKRSAPFVDET